MQLVHLYNVKIGCVKALAVDSEWDVAFHSVDPYNPTDEGQFHSSTLMEKNQGLQPSDPSSVL